jgi:hypothetical protein
MSVSINGTNGLTFNDGSAQTTAASGFGFKNRIINGAMVIDQRNAGASVTPTDGQYTLDRWQAQLSQASKYSVQQSTTAPAGFVNSAKITSLSAYSVGAGDYFSFKQWIEGFNAADFGWGTANAKTVTLSFQVYSSLTGTFGGVLQNGSFNRSYPFTYTISSANTWTSISVTIAGDTSGTWATNNTGGVVVIFGLGVGSTYSGTAGAWAGSNFISATGATSVVGTNGATLYITGVQLEKGSTATSFDYRPYGTELALCQRYFIRYGGYESSGDFGFGMAGATNVAYFSINFPVQMRGTPSVAGSTLQIHDTATAYTVTSVSAIGNETNPQSGYISASVASGLTQFRPYMLRTNSSTSGFLNYSAEL